VNSTQSEFIRKVYVIGAIFDKNNLKHESLKKAIKIKAKAYRFPLFGMYGTNQNKGLNIAQCDINRL